MINLDPQIASKPWQELIEEITRILDQDSQNLENNINYYQKIHRNPDTDIQKLENVYNKLMRDRNRFYYFSEILFRLQNPDLVNMMTGIENVFNKQMTLHGKRDEDFVIYFRKYQESSQVYYMPI